ncbi:MAG: glycosyltransferase [Timaviella obliquedivisa GSE-PSE-MK23-08B]|jgi:glycosyltransferase involved in cell wall biosynthesis|nr:glycosyltransferase [Timaviella obliquedivisa GSE-PSE-MK23-08B]
MKLTVIIPIYNRSRMLVQALNSLHWQTYKNFTVIVADDASSENLQEVVEQFPSLNIAYHRFDENLGQFQNAMRGASLCQTDFMKFLYSDDLLFPDALELQIKALEEMPESSICLGSYIEFEEVSDKKEIAIYKTLAPYIPASRSSSQWAKLENFNCFFPSACMYRTGIFHKIGGFNTTLSGIGDWELYVALSFKYPVVATDSVVCAMRLHPDQVTQKFFLNADSLQIKDVIWMTSKDNPYRERLNLPIIQQIFLRHQIFWRLLRMGIVSDDDFFQLLIKWLKIAISSKMLTSLVLSFPFFLAAHFLRKARQRSGFQKAINIDVDNYKLMIETLLFSTKDQQNIRDTENFFEPQMISEIDHISISCSEPS